jgi:hypothetical protein
MTIKNGQNNLTKHIDSTAETLSSQFDLNYDEIPSGLSTGEITTSANDYPDRRNESGESDYAIFGFASFEDAEKFADKIGTCVKYFQKRDGGHFWHDHGYANEPYTYQDYLRELGDNYSVACAEELFDEYKEQVSSADTLEEAEACRDTFNEIKKEIETAAEDEVIILCNGKYYETVKSAMMSFHEDVTTYEIGVLLPFSLEDENKDEN